MMNMVIIIIPWLITKMKSMKVIIIIMVIMIFPRIRTRMLTMLEYGHHDYLSQHDLAQDQNKDEAYDGHPYYHGHHN